MNAGRGVLNIAVSPDEKWIVSGTDNDQVAVWNAENHSKVTKWKAHNDLVRAVDVSPDGTRIATGSDDKTLCVWSLSTGQRLLGHFNHDGLVVAVKFSPNGRLIATATSKYVRVYDSQNGGLLVEFPVQVDSPFNQSLAWASDSKQLFALSRDGNIHCLNVSTRTTLSKWAIHSSKDPRCIALASNGTFIAASTDSSISFWDTATHEQIGSVIKHTLMIRCMAISTNYDLVISGGKTIVIRGLWDFLPYRCLRNVCVREKTQVRSLANLNPLRYHESLANGKFSTQKLKKLISGRPMNPFKYRTMAQVRSFVPRSRLSDVHVY